LVLYPDGGEIYDGKMQVAGNSLTTSGCALAASSVALHLNVSLRSFPQLLPVHSFRPAQSAARLQPQPSLQA
jgi:hypothetical protein